jgi:hypothetical protein
MTVKKIYHIYCDESRQTKDRFMVYGGIILSERYANQFHETLCQFRKDYNMMRELKWTKVCHQKEKEYIAFINHFFALNNANCTHFHSMIVDNHKTYNMRKGKGFYKLYYQFILHKYCNYYKPGVKFIVHPDQHKTTYKIDEFKNVLNNGIKKHLKIEENPFVSVEPKDSKLSTHLQIADVLIGGIGYIKNKYDLLSNACKTRVVLSHYILEQAGITDVDLNTPKQIKRFTVWNLRPSTKK